MSNITIVTAKDKNIFNKLASHPLQSWEWGEFRIKTGIEVVRLGKYEKDKLIETAQITIHPLPSTSWTLGYFPKGSTPSQAMLAELVNIGKKYNCIFIKLEPNVEVNKFSIFNFPWPGRQSRQFSISKSPHPLFTKYTLQLDLTKSEEELLTNMHPKTRYNIKVAQKHGVIVKEDDSPEAFEKYLTLSAETTKRQKFFAHTKRYHQLMWETLKPTGMAHLLTATYPKENNIILVAWVLFFFNGILYYPYGASSEQYRNTMASNFMMWEAIRLGKKYGARLFDMWGSLGPEPDPCDPWYGFHKFKLGYNPRLVEFAGSFDLVISPHLYRIYNKLHLLRELLLKIKTYL